MDKECPTTPQCSPSTEPWVVETVQVESQETQLPSNNDVSELAQELATDLSLQTASSETSSSLPSNEEHGSFIDSTDTTDATDATSNSLPDQVTRPSAIVTSHGAPPTLPVKPAGIAQAVASHPDAGRASIATIPPQVSPLATPPSSPKPTSPPLPTPYHPCQPTTTTDSYDVLARRLEYLLTSPDVDIIPEAEFRSIVFQIGVPEGLKMRSLVWKLLLKYLPWDRRLWTEHFRKARREYAAFINMLTVNPYADMEDEWKKRDAQRKEEQRRRAREEDEREQRRATALAAGLPFDDDSATEGATKTNDRQLGKTQRLKGGEDPLACGVGSNKWTEYYRDQDIRTEIEKDVKRTYSTLHFFQLPVHPDDRLYHNALLRAQAEAQRAEQAQAQSARRSSANQIPLGGGSTPKPAGRSGDLSEIAPIIKLSADPPASTPSSQPKRTPDLDLDLDLDAVPSIFGDMTTPGQRPAQRHLGGDLSLGGDLLASKPVKTPTQPASVTSTPTSTLKGTAVQPLDLSSAKQPECHHDVLRRVLFLFAKLNPGIRYVQGMNEILAPIYYVCAHDPDSYSMGKGKSCQQAMGEQGKSKVVKDAAVSDLTEEQKNVVPGEETQTASVQLSTSSTASSEDTFDFADPEADAFFCFSNIMSELRDRFIKSLDASETGVLATVRKLNEHLKSIDFELWKHLEAVEVDPRFYSFRWLTLLLSQEFQLPEVIRLWDAFFAEDNGFDFQLTFCCAMLVKVRETLLQMDFAGVLKLLQQYPDTDIQELLHIAHDLKAHGSRSQYIVSRKQRQNSTELSTTSRIANFFKNLTKK